MMQPMKEIIKTINRRFIDIIIDESYNDKITRDKITTEVKKDLFDLGVETFAVTCDERNNPPSVIDDKDIKIDVSFRSIENSPGFSCMLYETSCNDLLKRGVLVQTPLGLMRATDLHMEVRYEN